MPLQNRVTPFGDIVAIDQRGMFTGNRGIIHDPSTKTLLPRRWSSKAWIVCVLRWKNTHRDVMATRSWTELFFLDEAVALAAGHRPCFACRYADAVAFRDAWRSANAQPAASAKSIDDVLYRERLDKNRKRLHPVQSIERLPDGTMVSVGDDAFTIADGKAFRWTTDGYEKPRALRSADALITPPSTLRAMQAGYRPTLHTDIVRATAR